MKLFVCRKKKKNGEGTYLAIEARAEWGKKLISYDSNTILEIIPYGIDHRQLDEIGVEIGYITD